mmetsp:Transcript_15505/g.10871  ORF Transcript_15505/g.10871 Transcript_15505/m.10871 type:complete len:125 (+) Transcript_15505:139-513(+)
MSLTFDRKSGKAIEHEVYIMDEKEICAPTITIFGLLGVLLIKHVKYLVVITGREEVCHFRTSLKIDDNPKLIFHLTKVNIIPLNESLDQQNRSTNNPIKEKIMKYMSHGFYYSNNHDLTLSAQK